MLNSKTARIVAGLVGFALVLAVVAVPTAAKADATSDLIASLTAQLASLTAQLNALKGGSAATTFVSNLTVGSRGAEVTALQNKLGVSPATGYFGAITKAAVVAYQASKGISATGFVGPLTRASLNAGAVVTTPGTPSTPSSTVGTEGSFTVKQAAQPANNTNVTSSSNVPVYGVEIKAQDSDMTIDRADLEFAITVNSTTVNPSGFITNVSAWDGSTLLKSMNVSSADFTKDSSNKYYVRLTGLGFKVAKGATKSLTFSINTTGVSSADYARVMTVIGWSGTTQNIRGVDTAGLNSYGNDNWTSSFTFNATNNATLTGSANVAATPKDQTIAVNTTDGVRGVTMEVFDLKSTIGDSSLTDLRAYVKTSVSTAAPTALYLYDGSTLLASASVTVTSGSGTVNFSNLDVAIAKDQTKSLTLKADFPSTAVGIASTTIATSASETNTTMFDTADGSSKEVTIASALTGNDVHLYADSAPAWTLVSASATGSAGVVSVASSSITGTITLNVKANGGTLTKPVAGDFDIYFASSTQLTTNGGTGYTSATGISVTPTVTVTPNDSTVGDGGSYNVTISGTIYSNNASFGSSQPLFMAVNSIDSVITKTSSSNTITNQNWGIDNFYTNSVQLTKGTL